MGWSSRNPGGWSSIATVWKTEQLKKSHGVHAKTELSSQFRKPSLTCEWLCGVSHVRIRFPKDSSPKPQLRLEPALSTDHWNERTAVIMVRTCNSLM
jgi:hypothetical protein